MITATSAKTLFHVHTYRCGHGEMISDEAYVKRALELQAEEIWFTDHAPFPGDPFKNRMRYQELDEYLSALWSLKAAYASQIQIHIGLETEYFPAFDRSGYYRRLKEDERLELLLLGQHMAEDEAFPGQYTFSWDKERLRSEESQALGQAICQGISSGYFGAVAHPDRIFRRQTAWNREMERISCDIIENARRQVLPLEQNISSIRHKGYYRKEFWTLAKEAGVPLIFGLDAHWLKELVLQNTVNFISES